MGLGGVQTPTPGLGELALASFSELKEVFFHLGGVVFDCHEKTWRLVEEVFFVFCREFNQWNMDVGVKFRTWRYLGLVG